MLEAAHTLILKPSINMGPAVLFLTQLLFMQVHRDRVNTSSFKVQPDSLPPLPSSKQPENTGAKTKKFKNGIATLFPCMTNIRLACTLRG